MHKDLSPKFDVLKFQLQTNGAHSIPPRIMMFQHTGSHVKIQLEIIHCRHAEKLIDMHNFHSIQ